MPKRKWQQPIFFPGQKLFLPENKHLPTKNFNFRQKLTIYFKAVIFKRHLKHPAISKNITHFTPHIGYQNWRHDFKNHRPHTAARYFGRKIYMEGIRYMKNTPQKHLFKKRILKSKSEILSPLTKEKYHKLPKTKKSTRRWISIYDIA